MSLLSLLHSVITDRGFVPAAGSPQRCSRPCSPFWSRRSCRGPCRPVSVSWGLPRWSGASTRCSSLAGCRTAWDSDGWCWAYRNRFGCPQRESGRRMLRPLTSHHWQGTTILVFLFAWGWIENSCVTSHCSFAFCRHHDVFFFLRKLRSQWCHCKETQTQSIKNWIMYKTRLPLLFRQIPFLH